MNYFKKFFHKSRELDPGVLSLPVHLENNLRGPKGDLGWVIKSCRSPYAGWKLGLLEAASCHEICDVWRAFWSDICCLIRHH